MIILSDEEARLLDSLPYFEERGLSPLELNQIKELVISHARIRIQLALMKGLEK